MCGSTEGNHQNEIFDHIRDSADKNQNLKRKITSNNTIKLEPVENGPSKLQDQVPPAPSANNMKNSTRKEGKSLPVLTDDSTEVDQLHSSARRPTSYNKQS